MFSAVTLALIVGLITVGLWLWYTFNKKDDNYWSKQKGVVYAESGISFLVRLITGNMGFYVTDKPIYDKLKKHGFGGIMEVR